MEAHNRFLPDWFSRIRTRQITLPRFQRFEAWEHSAVADLLTTVVRGLPSGTTLILEVGDAEKFISRTMIDAPQTGERVTEQLLDGQQRLTALWRSLNDKYPDRTFLVTYEDDPSNADKKQLLVYGQSRWSKNGVRYPVWVDDPKECWKRECVPVRLLRPGDIGEEVNEWIEKAIVEADQDIAVYKTAYKNLSQVINELRTKVSLFNLPHLSLPVTTPKEVALDVFVKMNTSSVRLSTYDIVVALVEEETGQSLHSHVEVVQAKVPRASEYADLPELVLDVVALRQDRIPSQAGYRGIDYKRMIQEWDFVVAGIDWMTKFLEEECIFDAQRLPSYTAIPVLAALAEFLPKKPDELGNARCLLRKYLWRAFLTSRYEQSSASNAFQDYRGLRDVLRGLKQENAVPIMNHDSYPLPTKEMLLLTDWPKRKTITGRGVLAMQLRFGAEDLADGLRASVASITSKDHPREYHHLFPEATLEDAGVPHEQIYRALNCALITWRTNRVISDKDPIVYLKERADNSTLGESEVKRRLTTHLIPYSKLSVGYDGLSDDLRKPKVRGDYQAFLQKRAEIMEQVASKLCTGSMIALESLGIE